MKRFFSILSRALLIAGVSMLGLAASPAPSGAEEVERLERELVAAIGKKDLATYDRIVADDYVAFQSAGQVLTKSEIMSSYRAGSRGYSGLEIYDVQGRVYGDTAVVSAKTKGFRHEEGRDVPNRVHYIRVFARRDGKWRAVSQMSAPLPAESEPKKAG
jgi:ketosteroid isomerase-like protein